MPERELAASAQMRRERRRDQPHRVICAHGVHVQLRRRRSSAGIGAARPLPPQLSQLRCLLYVPVSCAV
jgi:glyoxylase-like metal-dependent hydrolase (beta-lactamase superfamily II)